MKNDPVPAPVNKGAAPLPSAGVSPSHVKLSDGDEESLPLPLLRRCSLQMTSIERGEIMKIEWGRAGMVIQKY